MVCCINDPLEGSQPSPPYDSSCLKLTDHEACLGLLCASTSPPLRRTCESFRPSLLASFFLSGLLMYFCFWKVLSRAFRWRSEKTARRSMPLLGFPLGARGQEKVPGTGTTEEEAGGTKHRRQWEFGQPEAENNKSVITDKYSSGPHQNVLTWNLLTGFCSSHDRIRGAWMPV